MASLIDNFKKYVFRLYMETLNKTTNVTNFNTKIQKTNIVKQLQRMVKVIIFFRLYFFFNYYFFLFHFFLFFGKIFKDFIYSSKMFWIFKFHFLRLSLISTYKYGNIFRNLQIESKGQWQHWQHQQSMGSYLTKQ